MPAPHGIAAQFTRSMRPGTDSIGGADKNILGSGLIFLFSEAVKLLSDPVRHMLRQVVNEGKKLVGRHDDDNAKDNQHGERACYADYSGLCGSGNEQLKTRPDKSAYDIDWIGVKASQFSFSRLHKADPVLGVDMSSTGEVGCLGDDFDEALLNAMVATGFKIPAPEKGVMFSSGAMKSKVDLLDASRMLHAKGYKIYATAGTSAFLNAHGVETTPVYWPDEKPDAENNVMRMIANHAFDLIVNIPKNHTKRELTNGYKIRRAAIDHNIPLITNARLAGAFIEAFCNLKPEDIAIKSWQEYK